MPEQTAAKGSGVENLGSALLVSKACGQAGHNMWIQAGTKPGFIHTVVPAKKLLSINSGVYAQLVQRLFARLYATTFSVLTGMVFYFYTLSTTLITITTTYIS